MQLLAYKAELLCTIHPKIYLRSRKVSTPM